MDLKENKTEFGEDTLIGRYLTFLIDKETYGIEIRYVMEIVGLQTITAMPEMPVYIKGIINLRGKIIPVMDIRIRFGKEAKEYDDRTCVIVISYKEIQYGFIVDSVSEVMTISDEFISERPKIENAEICGYIRNIGKADQNVILLVDCGRLLSVEDYDGICDTIS